ncbi:potassium-transporting ATPase subunit KdpC [Deinococcus psychrotolerans]|uniref:Potassium-transporting ATPase KdpC subunit n=1 Tax=Deinococcus psychrotolerans TaxID=2489213 RepID=A0A3G8YHE0_9DEIO|nr:potassium-transporting ATPase subunit KdpC [Deinococcus psychrotolerans]AZI44260.1 potassium-transporting ATPase subunit KdpC [Deinococcus psychrotolerans]
MTTPPIPEPDQLAPDLDSRGGNPLTWISFAILTFLLAGLLYPAVTTLIAGAIFPAQANGSLITVNGKVVGSALVGQTFSGDQYFIGRPSAAGNGYDPTSASGSNLASSNPALRTRVQADSAAIAKREGVSAAQIPADLVTASGSGLDPHISPAGAAIQVARVARVRNLGEEKVRELVSAATEKGVLGLGESGVNVLKLNLALDAAAPTAGR